MLVLLLVLYNLAVPNNLLLILPQAVVNSDLYAFAAAACLLNRVKFAKEKLILVVLNRLLFLVAASVFLALILVLENFVVFVLLRFV